MMMDFFYGRQWKLNLRATTTNCERQMRVPQSEIQIRCQDNLTQIRKVLKNRFRVSTSDEKKEKKNFAFGKFFIFFVKSEIEIYWQTSAVILNLESR